MAFVDLNDAIIAQVRDAADIVDFVQQVTPLKLAGALMVLLGTTLVRLVGRGAPVPARSRPETPHESPESRSDLAIAAWERSTQAFA